MNNELYHYGVLGMKWGVRRKLRRSDDFQNSKKNVKASHRNYLKAENDKDDAVRKAGIEFDKKHPYNPNASRDENLEREIDRYVHVLNKSHSASQKRDAAKTEYKQLLDDTVKRYGDTLVGNVKISDRSRQRIDRIVQSELLKDLWSDD